MKAKKYKIKTIEDIAKIITFENRERLVKDIAKALFIVPEFGEEFQLKEIEWIDDGKIQILKPKLINEKV